jgi:hypothetical protein
VTVTETTPPAGPPTGAAPSGFALSIPPNWYEVDVHPNTRNSAINALVAQRTKAVPELFAHRSTLVRALRAAARTAYSHGAVYCGVLAEGFGSALLTGSVSVSVAEAPDGSGPVGDYLRPLPRTGENSRWRIVEQTELPHVGRVTRTRGVEDISLPDGTGWVRTAVLQTFVPIPETSRVALITGSSPVLPLATEMLDLFDAITSTFRFQ